MTFPLSMMKTSPDFKFPFFMLTSVQVIRVRETFLTWNNLGTQFSGKTLRNPVSAPPFNKEKAKKKSNKIE